MPLNSKITACSHIKVNGVRCASPAMYSQAFCYFHQRMIRGVKIPPESRIHHMALIEDSESIQASLMEVINALVRDTIDIKRAQLILRALYIAVRNSPRAHFDFHKSEMVTEVPDYPAVPAPPPFDYAIMQAAVLKRVDSQRRYRADHPEEYKIAKEERANQIAAEPAAQHSVIPCGAATTAGSPGAIEEPAMSAVEGPALSRVEGTPHSLTSVIPSEAGTTKGSPGAVEGPLPAPLMPGSGEAPASKNYPAPTQTPRRKPPLPAPPSLIEVQKLIDLVLHG